LTATAGEYSKTFRLTLKEKEKKAIYFLPGHPGSELYDMDGNNVWTDRAEDELQNPDLLLADDEIGNHSRIQAIVGTDDYGAMDEAQALIDHLVAEFEGNGYAAVHFFSYNWLNSIDEAVIKLEEHIENNGYDKVVLVTHSTGGLVGSAYIAKGDNYKKVERAALIAPPLFGTNFALEPLETGKFDQVEEKIDTLSVVVGIIGGPIFGVTTDGGLKWRVRDSIKKIVKNDPTLYQLLPSDEYLGLMPQLFELDGDEDVFEPDIWTTLSRRITPAQNIGQFYAQLNGSENVNRNLTNGLRNERSHYHLRNNLLKGGVFNILKKVDYKIFMGTGLTTPAVAVYKQKISGGSAFKEILCRDSGDGTVLFSSTTGRIDTNNLPENIKTYPGMGHTVANVGTLFNDVTDWINGVTASASALSAKSQAPDEGMESFIKLRIEANKNVDIRIVDDQSQTVASVIDAYNQGFDKIRFNYQAIQVGEDVTEAVIYLPSSGYKVVYSYGDAKDAAIDFQVLASTLNYDGFNTSAALYTASKTSAGGEIITLDALGQTVTPENIGSMLAGQTVDAVVFYDDWEIEPEKTLAGVGATATIELTGADAEAGNVT
jgi:pimeloyl-ACP methyl ester carboxylesterase